MEKLLDESELAKVLGVSVLTVRRNRSTHPDRLPPYIKFGSSVRYRLESVLKWLEAHEIGAGAGNAQNTTTKIEPSQPPNRRRGPGRPSKLETVQASKNASK